MLTVIRNSLRVSVNSVARLFQTSTVNATEKFDHKRIPASDEGVQGERLVDLDAGLKKNVFPTIDSDDYIFDGMPFKKIPICNVRVSQNNTVLSLTDHSGLVKLIRSCGMDGFRNTKKGTNIAAQTSAIALANKAIDKGFRTVRVKVRGLGPGRLAAIKGLQMGGLQVVSITDSTPVSWNPPRARKARRL